jgi:hypothetical protein
VAVLLVAVLLVAVLPHTERKDTMDTVDTVDKGDAVVAVDTVADIPAAVGWVDPGPVVEPERCYDCGVALEEDAPPRMGRCRACDERIRAWTVAVARGELSALEVLQRIIREHRVHPARARPAPSRPTP